MYSNRCQKCAINKRHLNEKKRIVYGNVYIVKENIGVNPSQIPMVYLHLYYCLSY